MKKHEVRESEMNNQAFYAYSNSSYTVYEDGDGFAIALNEREKPEIHTDDLEGFFQQVYNEDCVWYAVMKDREDTDHGYGSNDLEEAKEMCREMKEENPDAYIAVISPADDFCVEEIEVECEARYRVKDEFVYNWTSEDVDELIVTEKEIRDLAKGWAVSVEELMEQVEEA